MSGVTSREISASLMEEIKQNSGTTVVGGGGIHVGETPPTNSENIDTWYETGLGDFEVPDTVEVIVSNAVISDDEPTGDQLNEQTKLWYDIEP